MMIFCKEIVLLIKKTKKFNSANKNLMVISKVLIIILIRLKSNNRKKQRIYKLNCKQNYWKKIKRFMISSY